MEKRKNWSVSWAELHRPQKLEEIIGNAPILEILQKYEQDPDATPHLMAIGPPGCGKTASLLPLARVLTQKDPERLLVLNASDDRGLGVVREKMRPFVDAARDVQVCVLDEADSLTREAQLALRRLMDLAQERRVRFFLIGNRSLDFEEALQSRCQLLRYQPLTEDELVSQVLQKVVWARKARVTLPAMKTIAHEAKGDARRALILLETACTAKKPVQPRDLDLVSSIAQAHDSLQALFFSSSSSSSFAKLKKKEEKEEEEEEARELRSALEAAHKLVCLEGWAVEDVVQEIQARISLLKDREDRLEWLRGIAAVEDSWTFIQLTGLIARVCQDISVLKDNACGLAPCVAKVAGTRSNSASPSDTWHLFFKNGTLYAGETLSGQAFSKNWIKLDRYHLDKIDDEKAREALVYAVSRLDYEAKVYRNVITPLIDSKVCPNFVRLLAFGETCDYKDLLKMLGDANAGDAKKANVDLRLRLSRNVYFMLSATRGRPSINDPFDKETQAAVDFNSLARAQFRVLVTEIVNGPTFLAWLLQYDLSRPFDQEVWGVIAQVLAGLYALECSRMNHRDLHLNNILMREQINLMRLLYEYEDLKLVIETRSMPHIYDFDFSFAEAIGPHPRHPVFYPKLDMLKFFQGVWRQCPSRSPNKDKIVSLLFPNATKSTLKVIEKWFEKMCFNNSGPQVRGEDGLIRPNPVYQSAAPVLDVFRATTELAKLGRGSGDVAGVDAVFTCKRSMFGKNGALVLGQGSREAGA